MKNTIQEILNELEQSDHPVAKKMSHQGQSRILAIGFRKGMTLKDHRARETATLLVLQGELVYREAGNDTIIRAFEEFPISPGVTHAVFANENSICLLMQG